MRRGGLPGHMAKARRIAREKVGLVDMVLEVVDARAPLATHSVDADALAERKPRLLIMSHSDLAAPMSTSKWLSYWQQQNVYAFAIDAVRGEGLGPLQTHLKRAGMGLNERLAERGRRHRPLRAIVIGLPNVGKSSLLNRLTRGKAKARTGAKPGITRGEQWLRSGNIELLDLPGMLPVQAGDTDAARILQTVGILSLDRFDAVELCTWLLKEGLGHQTEEIASGVGISYRPGEEMEFLRSFAVSRGRLASGGRPELEDAALQFARGLQQGKWGRFTLEEPPHDGEL